MQGHLYLFALMIGLTSGLAGACRPAEDVDPFTKNCSVWCAKRSGCGFVADDEATIEGCADFCVDSIELYAPEFGQACITAYEQAMHCLARLSCDDYALLTFIPETEQPCRSVLDPYYQLCPGVFLAPAATPKEKQP